MRKRFALVPLLCLVLACLFCSAARADELTQEKIADTKKMLAATETGVLGEQLTADMAGRIMSILQAERPDLDSRTIKIVVREMRAFLTEKIAAPGGLLDRLAPIYARHFTHEEIKRILAFYESPAGQKVVATFPRLMEESQQAGIAFARDITPELQRRIKAALEKDAGEVAGAAGKAPAAEPE